MLILFSLFLQPLIVGGNFANYVISIFAITNCSWYYKVIGVQWNGLSYFLGVTASFIAFTHCNLKWVDNSSSMDCLFLSFH